MDMNNNVISKADLWADRIHAFQESGLSRKDWCQQNEIPPSALGYWIRKIQSESPGTEPASDPVEYSCAGVPLFRRNGYRQSGGRKPLFRNRDTAYLRVYSLKAGSNPYTSRMDL